MFTLHKDQYTLMNVCRSILIRMKNISDKYRENKSNILYLINAFENHSVYNIKRKNTVEPGRQQMTIWRMRILCWITKATDTHSRYVILTAFPLKQLLQERSPF